MTNTWNTVLYTGMTGAIGRRMDNHRQKVVPSFTEKYHIWKLVFVESFLTPQEAADAERKIKKWSRKKKIALIESRNPKWSDLSCILE